MNISYTNLDVSYSTYVLTRMHMHHDVKYIYIYIYTYIYMHLCKDICAVWNVKMYVWNVHLHTDVCDEIHHDIYIYICIDIAWINTYCIDQCVRKYNFMYFGLVMFFYVLFYLMYIIVKCFSFDVIYNWCICSPERSHSLNTYQQTLPTLHSHTHTTTYTYTHTHTHIHTHTHTTTYNQTLTHAYTHIQPHTHTHSLSHTKTLTNTHNNARTHTHTTFQ